VSESNKITQYSGVILNNLEATISTLRVVPKLRVERYERAESIGWALPMDDTSIRVYVAGCVRELAVRTSRA
jgi:hypothetical protein